MSSSSHSETTRLLPERDRQPSTRILHHIVAARPTTSPVSTTPVPAFRPRTSSSATLVSNPDDITPSHEDVPTSVPNYRVVKPEPSKRGDRGKEKPDGPERYSQRAPGLRAAVLGANDGLVSISSLMLGFAGAGGGNRRAMILSGVAGTVAGALSMACGEYVSVASQKDSEIADVKREREEFLKGPEHVEGERNELARVYMDRGLDEPLANQVVDALHTNADGDLSKIVAIHVRDELAIDVNEFSNPILASVLSAVSFCVGALWPFLPGLILTDALWSVVGIIVASSVGLVLFGAAGAVIGGACWWRGALRVLVGGWVAMAGTYGVGLLFDKLGAV
ncbi:VIT family-domain-containing protein [Chytridium lagenaria]|nr:VIT family-domain-containing protein [Chytridium lagenaria]